jgi:hypothetical protein
VTSHLAWYRRPDAWRLVLLRFAPLLAGLDLVWEITQLPLYTIWHESDLGKIAFAVLHCTAGDIGIGVSALLLGLLINRAKDPRTWHYPALATTMTILAVAYTAFSEWLNARVLHSWTYSDLMPVISPFGIGLAPLLQWVVIPPLALALAMTRTRATTMKERT